MQNGREGHCLADYNLLFSDVLVAVAVLDA